MTDEQWTFIFIIFVGVMLIMARLDRLGRQLEAVSALIRSDVARTQEERDEVMRDWKENKQQEAKDVRQFWTFWSIVGAGVLGWYVFTHYR
jgi:hypothetical protein